MIWEEQFIIPSNAGSYAANTMLNVNQWTNSLQYMQAQQNIANTLAYKIPNKVEIKPTPLTFPIPPPPPLVKSSALNAVLSTIQASASANNYNAKKKERYPDPFKTHGAWFLLLNNS